MTRLEEVEKQIANCKNLNELQSWPLSINYAAVPADLLYALDCYRARVAVLEEALDKIVNHVWEHGREDGGLSPWRCVDMAIFACALTPEQCLERTNKESLTVQSPHSERQKGAE